MKSLQEFATVHASFQTTTRGPFERERLDRVSRDARDQALGEHLNAVVSDTQE
jgi:hypothetical protein